MDIKLSNQGEQDHPTLLLNFYTASAQNKNLDIAAACLLPNTTFNDT